MSSAAAMTGVASAAIGKHRQPGNGTIYKNHWPPGAQMLALTCDELSLLRQ